MQGFSAAAALGLVVVWSGSAAAADKPRIGEPEAWVRAASADAKPSAEAAGAAVAMLLEDVQLRFDPAGQSQYVAYRMKVQTAAGLGPLGTVTFPWSPATDTLTLHRVRLLREGRSLDQLPKDGAFTIIRREQKLESDALLDGVLTAIVQPEGLQVGDVLEVAYTLRREDPLLKGRADAVVGALDTMPLSQLSIRASWPKASPVRWRAANGMPQPRVTTQGGETEAVVAAADLMPIAKPGGAPARFQLGRTLDFTSYASWAEVSALMAPLYEAAARLAPGSPVLAQAKAIAASSPDPSVRTAAALALVQEKVRYLAQAMGDAGLKPAAADATWSRRFGDCKAKTALLLALLTELGVKAEPVLVASTLGDGLNDRLPSLSAFDHVIVRAFIGGRDYWLDGTRRGDSRLEAVSTPNWGYVLPVRASGATLVRLQPEPLKLASASSSIRIDASKGITLPAPAHLESVFRGDAARELDAGVANMTPAQRDAALRAYWAKQYDFIEVKSASAAYDPATGEERFVMDGSAKLDWAGGYEADGANLGWKMDLKRQPGPHADAPFAVGFPAFESREETIVLPDKGRGFTVAGDDVDRQLAGYAFRRKSRIENGVFHMEASSRALTPEISLADAKAAAEPLAAMARTTVRIKVPPNGVTTEDEVTAALDSKPSTFQGHLDRAWALMSKARFKDVVAEYDKALSLDPTSARALASRGLTRVWLNEEAAANADLDRAEKLDPKLGVIWRARGLLAANAKRWPDAISALSRALELTPDDSFALWLRMEAFTSIKDYPHALEDADRLLHSGAWAGKVHAVKAAIYGEIKDFPKLRAEAALIDVESETAEWNREERVDVLWQAGDKEGTRVAADKAIADNPSAHLHVLRAAVRPATDAVGRKADIEAAYKLDPKSYEAVSTLANMADIRGDLAEARTWAEKAVALNPDEAPALLLMAKLRFKESKDRAAAARDFSKVRAKVADDPEELNSLCYDQAVLGVELDKALSDCDASLKLRPGSAGVLDSRAFVLLRLDRNKEALDTYIQALKVEPELSASLYGRSLVERRLGMRAEADQDLQAALKLSPELKATFDSYGVSR